MKISQHSIMHDLDHKYYINVDLVVPEFSAGVNYEIWAMALLERESWMDSAHSSDINTISQADGLYIMSFLHCTRLLCELGRLPIFDIPRFSVISESDQIDRKYLLKVELPLVHSMPQTAYQISLNTALKICLWMARNPPSSDNINKVFKSIGGRVIKSLHKIIPAGKSTIPVLRVAHALGIPFLHLGAGVYQLGWGSKARRMDRSTTELDSSMGAKLAQNKVVTSNLLRLAGLPAPIHVVVSTEAGALAAADRLGFPLVIKPTDLDRGEGVSVDVFDSDAVKLAFARAHGLSKVKQVIVERQVSGVCHRLFIANGRLLYAVKRLPMSVKADGERTVAQLVHDEISIQGQKAPWNRSEIKAIDDRALKAIADAGFSPQSIPAQGVWVPLRRIESTADGGVDEEVTTITHPDNLSAAIAAAKLFGLDIAGIDVISPDITKPWYENSAIINEVNFAPLFGGGEISRSHIPGFFAEFIDGNGKIPIEVSNEKAAALTKQAENIKKGLRCYFTTPTETFDFSGKPLVIPFNDIRKRLRALVCRSDVDAIVICLPTSLSINK